jgi:uncharacterized membrane protein
MQCSIFQITNILKKKEKIQMKRKINSIKFNSNLNLNSNCYKIINEYSKR